MNRVETKCKINVYEKNGSDIPIGKDEHVFISSHWNRGDFVVIKIDSSDEFTVVARDLIDAVGRCSR